MRRINLVVFNENYWSNPLIMSQNIMPLIKIAKMRGDVNIRLLSFTSVLMFFLNYKQIRDFKCRMKTENVEIINFPIFFAPSRLFIVRWFIVPYLYLNVLIYILFLSVYDIFQERRGVYILRSYVPALIFSTLYFGKNSLVFDPRTDFIKEQTRIKTWNESSYSYSLWMAFERIILKRCKASLFISTSFMNDVLNRHKVAYDECKHFVIYNPVDFSIFTESRNIKDRKMNFVYSGSLGNWNKLDNYLDLYDSLLAFFPNSKFFILTTGKKSRIDSVLQQEKYNHLLCHLEIVFNIPFYRMVDYYANSAFGLQIMDTIDSRLGVKVVEYFASGLIPIVSSTVLGAVELSNKYQLGLVIENKFDTCSYNELLKMLHDEERDDRLNDLSKFIDIDGYSSELCKILFMI